MRTEKVTFKSLGYDLVGILEYPKEYEPGVPTPGIILYHGLTNSKYDCPLINEVNEALVREGFITFRFDFYGSGESPGEMKDKTWSILEQNGFDAIRFFSENKDINKIGLWGRSTGGTIAILNSTHPLIKVYALASAWVLISSSIAKFKKAMELERELEKEGKVLPGTGKYKGEYSFNERFFEEAPIFEQKVLSNLAKMSHVLVLGTTPDRKVSLDNATTIINLAKEPKEIHIFEGVDHDYKGVEREAVNLVVKWFKKYLR